MNSNEDYLREKYRDPHTGEFTKRPAAESGNTDLSDVGNAGNPVIPANYAEEVEFVKKAMGDSYEDDEVWPARERLESFSAESVDYFTQQEEFEDAWVYVLRSIETQPNVLGRFRNHDDWTLRAAVAEHGNTPLEWLRELAKDEDTDVRAAIPRNEGCPEEIWGPLMNDRTEHVREAVAERRTWDE